MSEQPRPYVVDYRLPSGLTGKVHVTAYNLIEAVQATSMRLLAAGVANPTLVNIGPDLEALSAEAKAKESDAAVGFTKAIADLLRREPSNAATGRPHK